MPKQKLKTKSGAKKRFKITAKAKIRHNKAYRRHILEPKNRKRKRRLKKPAILKTPNVGQVRKLLPYG